MAQMLIEVDSRLLAEAADSLGVVGVDAVIDAALRHAVTARRIGRLRALEDLQAIAAAGGFAFDQLAALDE